MYNNNNTDKNTQRMVNFVSASRTLMREPSWRSFSQAKICQKTTSRSALMHFLFTHTNHQPSVISVERCCSALCGKVSNVKVVVRTITNGAPIKSRITALTSRGEGPPSAVYFSRRREQQPPWISPSKRRTRCSAQHLQLHSSMTTTLCCPPQISKRNVHHLTSVDRLGWRRNLQTKSAYRTRSSCIRTQSLQSVNIVESC